jgi:hypothetical protein
MDPAVVISLAVASYAALISTYLGFRELRKERRNLLVFLEFIPFYETAHFKLVNAGVRPITVVSVAMDIFFENDGVNPPHWETVPSRNLLDRKEGVTFLPVHIKDGEQALIPIYVMIKNMLVENHMKARIRVMDADGKTYTKHKLSTIDTKHATVPEVERD